MGDFDEAQPKADTLSPADLAEAVVLADLAPKIVNNRGRPKIGQ